MSSNGAAATKIVYRHRELPQIEAEAREEHVLEASSRRVLGGFAHRDDLWMSCQAELMGQASTRLEQEVARLGGRYAHVLSECIESHHDQATDEAWLKGRFTYMLYA